MRRNLQGASTTKRAYLLLASADAKHLLVHAKQALFLANGNEAT
jgi:hypothetical protein